MKRNNRIRIPVSQRKEQFRRVLIPLVVWISAVGIVAFQLYQRTDQFDYVGLARAEEYAISSEYQGRIESVQVGLYTDVSQGEVVARMKDDLVIARIATSTARVSKLRADLDSVHSESTFSVDGDRASWVADLRRFQVDEENRRLVILNIKVDLESDRVESERRSLELERIKRLMESKLATELEFDTVRLQTEQIRRRISENERLLQQTESEYIRAQQRRMAYEKSAPGLFNENPVLEAIRRAVTIESRLMEEIQVERQALVLRSPVSGRIARIDCLEGQAVRSGQTILAVAETEVKEIVAYLPDSEGLDLKPETLVSLSSRKTNGEVVESVVIRTGPGIELLPQRLWRDPVIPDYGYGIIIAAVPTLNLLPGELVDVRFLVN